jgi:hypothetical protein
LGWSYEIAHFAIENIIVFTNKCDIFMIMRFIALLSFLICLSSYGQFENPYVRINSLEVYSLSDQIQRETFNHWITTIYSHPANCPSIAPMLSLNLPQSISLTPPHQQFGQALLLFGLNVLSRGSIAPSLNTDRSGYYAPHSIDQ